MKHFYRLLTTRWFALTTPAHSPMNTLAEREWTRKVRLLSVCLFFALGASLPFVTLGSFGVSYIQILCNCLEVSTMLLALYLNKRGYLKGATFTFLSSAIFSTVITAHMLSQADPILIFWLWTPLALPLGVAGLFLPFWAPLLLAIIECVFMFAYILFIRHVQIVHLLSGPEQSSFLIYICMLIITSAILGAVFASTLNRAVSQADRAVELEYIHAALTDAYAQVERLATIDPITNLLNHRAFNEHLSTLELTDRPERFLGIIFIDLDHFKAINDAWGHKVGDDVLLHLATCLLQGVRTMDIVARYGGEEFIVMLPDSDVFSTQQVAERVRVLVAATPFRLADGQAIPLTLSAGVAVFPGHGVDSGEIIQAADTAMYQAKHAGRNQVCIASTLEGAARAEDLFPLAL
ncbi:MAG: GGDEF domain-containing protein [Ktedonobacteraceae bacterium]|nr:GGDEF domain-containing protein [Chloroflexota bacterium]